MQTISNQPKINWMNAIFLTSLPIITVASLVAYLVQVGFYWGDLAIFLVMYTATGLGVTGGYHRHFSHKAFDCHPIAQFLFAFFGAGALENSILCWCTDHRTHHRYVDSEKDPYNVNKGFFWAHMGWIYYDDSSKRTFENVPDLKKNKIVMWQHKYYLIIAVIAAFVFPMFLGWVFFDRPIGGLVWGGLVRQLATHHSTFLINSAAHWFGTRPYSRQNTARDSWWLAFLSFGEGYHNFHHAFQSDYRNGLKWYQWDPTKWLIGVMSACKLSWNLRRTPKETIQRAVEAAKTGATETMQQVADSVHDQIDSMQNTAKSMNS